MKLDLKKDRWENRYKCASISSVSYQFHTAIVQNDVPFDIVIEFIDTNAYRLHYLCGSDIYEQIGLAFQDKCDYTIVASGVNKKIQSKLHAIHVDSDRKVTKFLMILQDFGEQSPGDPTRIYQLTYEMIK